MKKNPAAQALGRLGGYTKTEAKSEASRANGKKGGRPTIDIAPMLNLIDQDGPLCLADYYRKQYPAEWRKAVRLDKINVWRDDAGTEYVEVGGQK